MKLATLRMKDKTRAARLDGDVYVGIDGFNDVGDLLKRGDWRALAESASGPKYGVGDVEIGPVVSNPGKIICVGANYVNHIKEMGTEVPSHPTLFAKYPEALVGPNDDIHLPPGEPQADWEGELAVIIGKRTRNVVPQDAGEHVAGFSVMNDVSMREYQFRSMQWLQGKTWEKSSPFGPWLVTPEEFDEKARIQTSINGQVMQDDTVDATIFGVHFLVAYISEIISLQAGDVVITGTPAGVGVARDPKKFINAGDELETSITGLGTQRNVAVSKNPQ